VLIPHVGWNDITLVGSDPLFANIAQGADFYFVHSYHLLCRDERLTIATCDYGTRFTAAIRQGSIFATQFHPEKSQRNGLMLLANFINYCHHREPAC